MNIGIVGIERDGFAAIFQSIVPTVKFAFVEGALHNGGRALDLRRFRQRLRRCFVLAFTADREDKNERAEKRRLANNRFQR